VIVDKDLAVLLMAARYYDGAAHDPVARAAHERVEAELSRLREQRDVLTQNLAACESGREVEREKLRRDLSAAEARAHRIDAERDAAVREVNALGHRLSSSEALLGVKARKLEAAEARCARLQQALAMLWQHYLLPITDEQKRQVAEALAGTDTPADSPPPRSEHGGYMGGEPWGAPATRRPTPASYRRSPVLARAGRSHGGRPCGACWWLPTRRSRLHLAAHDGRIE
jgi:HPt (histidine-containing phosphotransfer) domain-containing protein